MNDIHPTAIIGEQVMLGNGNKILPYTIIEGPVEIGDDNTIGPFACIGVPATDTKNTENAYADAKVLIGSGNCIREYCVIEQPCYENLTQIADKVFLMQGVHVSHDVVIHDRAVVTNLSVIAGLVKILEGANIAMGCTLNQYSTIGQYSIVATNSACMKNVRPFSRYIPGKPISVNYYALKKFEFETYRAEVEAYVLRGVVPKGGPIREIVEAFDAAVARYGRETYGG